MFTPPPEASKDDGPRTPGAGESHSRAEELRRSAEEVRGWLVELRGGGAFLSPRDGALLHGWLEAGVSVPHILRALEAAAEKRRAKPSRVPLSLHACKPFVERGGGSASRSGTRSGTASPLPESTATDWPAGLALQERTLAEAARATLTSLRQTPDPEARLAAACQLVRSFQAQLWEIASPLHPQLLAQAAEGFAAFRDTVDEATFAQLCEEAARGRFRQRHPDLTLSAVCEAP
jgi:hypothetical protein